MAPHTSYVTCVCRSAALMSSPSRYVHVTPRAQCVATAPPVVGVDTPRSRRQDACLDVLTPVIHDALLTHINIDTLYQIQRSSILIILLRYGDGLVIGFVYLRCWDVTNTCAHTLYIDCVLTTPLCLATTVVLLTSNAASQIFQRATIGSERIHNSHVKNKEQLLCCISSRHYF